MNANAYHVLIAALVAMVIAIVNILALYQSPQPSSVLYVVDIAYVAGNSIHAIALSLSPQQVAIQTQVQSPKT